jgi:hypothetical protein
MECLTNAFTQVFSWDALRIPSECLYSGVLIEWHTNAFNQVFSWDALRIPWECFGGNLSRIVGLDESYFVWDMKS